MCKQIIIDILDYLRYQVENDKCTADELRSIYRNLAENLDVDATTDDIARHFGKSRNAVCNLPLRHFISPPKRKVYYRFNEFLKHIPKSWRRVNTAEEQ